MQFIGIQSSVHDKNLQSTVSTILDDIDAVCDSSDIEDCHRIKGDRITIKFNSRVKSSEVLIRKRNLKIWILLGIVSMMNQGSTSMKTFAPTWTYLENLCNYPVEYGVNINIFGERRL